MMIVNNNATSLNRKLNANLLSDEVFEFQYIVAVSTILI